MRSFTRWWRVIVPAAAFGLALVLAVSRARSRPVPYDLGDIGYEKGNAAAEVVIIEFADFGCTACASFARLTLPQIEREWIASGRARLRLIPFDALKTGRGAARAAHCAAQQGAFWAMHDLLFNRHREWLARPDQPETFAGWAAQLGLDNSQFKACWERDDWEWLDRNTRLARSAGLPGTPAFVVNGRPLVGALPYSEFASVLQAMSDAAR